MTSSIIANDLKQQEDSFKERLKNRKQNKLKQQPVKDQDTKPEEESKYSKSEIQAKIDQFTDEFDRELAADIERITIKFTQQIEGYQKKGINALTKKLIEKTELELVKAVTKRKEDAA